MNIKINNKTVSLPKDDMSVKDVLQLMEIKSGGTAIAINDKLVKRDLWDSIKINDNDEITIITAAFGG